MPSPNEISVSQLSRLVGTPEAPAIIDVRNAEHLSEDARYIPCALRRDPLKVEDWVEGYRGQRVVVSCQHGRKAAQGTAAWLRTLGIEAESLEGGHEAYVAGGGPLVDPAQLPVRDARQRTVWVTRARPKIDRIACPWLIRRFIDPHAVLLYVTAAEVLSVAERFHATPYDIEGVFWSHRGERCTFDTLIEETGLSSPALTRLADIVRGADTARPDLAPEAAGLLAISLGLSRMHRDDLDQLDQAMSVYDALYRWARDATDETHHWPATTAKPAVGARA